MSETGLIKTSSNVVQEVGGIGQQAVKGGFDTLKSIIDSPMLSLVLSVALIEYMQGIQVWKGKTEIVRGSHDGGSWGTININEPLISQALATTLETAIITTDVIKSVGGTDLAKIISLFAK
jgi:hypothetical protein